MKIQRFGMALLKGICFTLINLGGIEPNVMSLDV